MKGKRTKDDAKKRKKSSVGIQTQDEWTAKAKIRK
jgi:hypothetical protein